MGSAVDDPAALAAELSRLEIDRWGRLLPAVAAANSSWIGVELNIPARDFGATLVWTVNLEDGERRSGTRSTADCPEIWRGEVEGSWITRRRFELPTELPTGRHELQVRIGGGTASRCVLLLSPSKCYEPPAIRSGRRLWGLAVQLYTVRSRRNWGIGDFGDLKALIRWLAPHGAGFIGLNPLHALAPADPERASPYSASSRHFLNVLYVSVPDVPEFHDCAAARARTSAVCRAARGSARGSARRLSRRGRREARDTRAPVPRFLRSASRARHRAARALSAVSWPRRPHACRCMRGSMRWTRIFARRSAQCLGMAELARRVSRPGRAGGGAALPRRTRSGSNSTLYLQWLAHEQFAAAQALGARTRHADRRLWRLCRGHSPVRIGDLGRPDGLSPAGRNRRAAGSAGAQGSGLGAAAARSGRPGVRSAPGLHRASFATTCATTAPCASIT